MRYRYRTAARTSLTVAAAAVLRARTLVPIHYGVDSPSVYEEQPDAVETVRRLCRERHAGVQIVEEGSWVKWPEVTAR